MANSKPNLTSKPTKIYYQLSLKKIHYQQYGLQSTNTLDKTSHTHILTQITLINTNELANLAYTHKPITFSFLVKETLLLPHQEKLFPYMPRNITKLNFEFVTISNTLELTYGV